MSVLFQVPNMMEHTPQVEIRVRPPSTTEYLNALQVIRAYLEFLGCSEREMDALLILESKLFLLYCLQNCKSDLMF